MRLTSAECTCRGGSARNDARTLGCRAPNAHGINVLWVRVRLREILFPRPLPTRPEDPAMRMCLLLLLCSLVVGQGEDSRVVPDWTALEWREWFVKKRHGLDAYFFFASGQAGVTGCPENARLSLVTSDSAAATLQLMDDRARPARVRAQCTLWYGDLRSHPRIARMRDGRAMWTLRGR